MECKKYLSLLGEYRDGELEGSALSAMKEHLSSCPNCIAELESLETLSGILTSIKAPRASESFENDVIRAMRNPAPRFSFFPSGRASSAPTHLRPLFFQRAVPVFAALALIIAGGLFYTRQDTPRDVSYAQLLISDAELRELDSEALDIFYGGI